MGLYAFEVVHWITGKLHNKNKGPKATDKKVIALKDRQTFWLIEVLYAIKRDALMDQRKVVCKKWRSWLKRWESYMPFVHFLDIPAADQWKLYAKIQGSWSICIFWPTSKIDRQTDIVAVGPYSHLKLVILRPRANYLNVLMDYRVNVASRLCVRVYL